MKILLVEDSKFLRLATERAMVRAGYDVTSAADGEEGLRLAREKLPDLILLDIMLPKLSGPDVLKALKLERPLPEKRGQTGEGRRIRLPGKIRARSGSGHRTFIGEA
jgi:CheY-like chemotaxis protein